jgi:hypothetical protein
MSAIFSIDAIAAVSTGRTILAVNPIAPVLARRTRQSLQSLDCRFDIR